MDNARCLWRRLFCFTKGNVAVHLSANWRQRCLFEPLGCKEMNSLAALSQSFSGAWLFMGDSLHGPQLSPVLAVIAISQRVALCKTRHGVLLHWNSCPRYPLVSAKRLNSHLFNSWPCFQVSTILDGILPSPVCCLKIYSSLLFLTSEQWKEKSLWNHIFMQVGKGNGVKGKKKR